MVGNSPLWGMEGPICRPDPTCREVCCLPGAHIRDITRKVPGLVCSSDYCPLLIVQVGSDEIAQGSLRAFKKDFRGSYFHSYFTLPLPHFLLWVYLHYSRCTHILLRIYSRYTPGLLTPYFKFTCTLLWVYSHIVLGCLTLYTSLFLLFSGCPQLYSMCSHTLLQLLLTLDSRFTPNLLRVHSHLSPVLLTVYSVCAHTLLVVLLAIYSRFYSRFTQGLLTLYSWFTHTLLLVLLTLHTRFTHTSFWVYAYAGDGEVSSALLNADSDNEALERRQKL